MSVKICLPISHHFESKEKVEKLRDLDLYDFLETRPNKIDYEEDIDKQVAFHADNIQPIHNLKDKDFKFIEKIAKNKTNLQVISFHCAWACDEIVETGIIAYPVGKVSSRDEMYFNAEKNISIIKNILGKDVRIALENNNYYPTPAYENVCDPSFLRDLVFNNEINFLFDNAHAKVSSHNLGVDYIEYKNQFPLERMVQIQFCQPLIPEKKEDMALDVHEIPNGKNVEEVLEMSTKFGVQYITPEYYKDFDKLVEFLKGLRSKQKQLM
jgi:uncharacterized protein (UPF0276 family)